LLWPGSPADIGPNGQDSIDSALTIQFVRTDASKPTALARPEVHRLDYIDGLRALAALWVLLHHTMETSEPRTAMQLPVAGPILSSLLFGQFPVMVFLMLSGFCLFYPCVRKNLDGPRLGFSYTTYLLRRARRIVPPYFAAGAFCVAMSFVPALQVGRWTITGPIDGSVIVSHLLLVHNLIPSHATKIDYPMWSIGLEWQLYLLFPLLIWAYRRSNALTMIAFTLALAVVVHETYRMLPIEAAAVLRDGPLAYLEIFAIGMFAASLTVQGRKLLPSWVLACVAIGGLAVVRLGSGNGLIHDLGTSAAAFSVLLLGIDSNGAVARFLRHTWLVRIGIFSYSIYLMHAPLIHILWFALRPLQLSPDVTFWILVVCAPLTIGVCYGFHLLFEFPFMRVR
jgi:peptidoglycan/LPS O-acetylase OafA/YrhL